MVHDIYTTLKGEPREIGEMSDDARRIWSARENVASGAEAVTVAIYPVFDSEKSVRVVCPMSRALNIIEIRAQIKTRATCKFHRTRFKKGEFVKWILAFWEIHVPATCLRGLCGRAHAE